MSHDPAARPGVDSEVLAQSDDVRFTLYTLEPGAEIPWHFHTEVDDWYFCRAGSFTVDSQAPDASVTLGVGDMHEMPARRVHRVVNTGDDTCQFALVQVLGKYDFNPFDG